MYMVITLKSKRGGIMNLIEAIDELEKVRNIYFLTKDSNKIMVYREDGKDLLNKNRLLNKRVYNIKRTGNEEAVIEFYEWRNEK